MFFSFDGVDGVGKSTQVTLFVTWLREQGKTVTLCRDPGSTALGEAVRGFLLERGGFRIDSHAEMLLYMAARAQLVSEVIRPALERGEVVVSDRFLLANVAYQAHGGGLAADDVWGVGRVATAGLLPDLTFLLDMPSAAAAKRRGREPDRLEARGLEYLEKVRAGFLHEAKVLGERVAVIDAGRDVAAVQESIRAAAAARLGAKS